MSTDPKPIPAARGELPFPPVKNCRQGGEHDWHTTDNWLIDRCAVCGEERA